MDAIFIDSNPIMYLVGAPHPLKTRTDELLRELIEEVSFFTSAEIFQELLYRYRSIHRYEDFSKAWDRLESMVEEIFPVTVDDVRAAGDLVMDRPTRGARDSIHVAVATRHKIRKIFTFDKGFSEYPMIEVIS